MKCLFLLMFFTQIAFSKTIEDVQKDFDSAIGGAVIPIAGSVMTWANGTLIRTKANQLRYSSNDPGCSSVNLDNDTDIIALAKLCPSVNSTWKSQYDLDLAKMASSNAPSSAATGVQQGAINQTAKSSIETLLAAAKRHDRGEISNDLFILIAKNVAKINEYSQNTMRPIFANTGVAGVGENEDPNKWLEVNSSILPQMRKDYSDYMNKSKPGDVLDWAGGKLYRRAEGALYVGPDGDSILLPDSKLGAPDFNNLALMNLGIADQWKTQYGFKPIGKTHYKNERGFSSDSYTTPIAENQLWYPKEYGIKIKSWIREIYNSLADGKSKTWKNNTVIRTGGPFCLRILSNDGLKSTSLCLSDDFDKNLPNDQFGSELAKENWGY